MEQNKIIASNENKGATKQVNKPRSEENKETAASMNTVSPCFVSLSFSTRKKKM